MIRIIILNIFFIYSVITSAEINDMNYFLDNNNNNDKVIISNEFDNKLNIERSPQTRRSGCSISVREDLLYPQPVYIKGDTFLKPSGTSGNILLNSGETILLACTGNNSVIQHPFNIKIVNFANVSCEGETMVTGTFLGGSASFGELLCSDHPESIAQETGQACFDGGRIIRVGFVIDNVFHPLYWSCFDKYLLSVVYVMYEQGPENAIFQSVKYNNTWRESFFGDLDINRFYTQVEQKKTIAGIVGQELADKYLTNTYFISRGHLAAKTDFIFASGQVASYYFINAAPQWQPFNGGNWEALERNLRKRIAELGAKTTVYTGTYGVTQLRNQQGELVDIHLVVDENNNRQLPVPMYFYKVVYDEANKEATAFIGINNPYYTLEEVKELQFCPDQCRNNRAFDWIGWNPDNISNGYSFCCTIDDFRLTIQHLPEMNVEGLFGHSSTIVLSKFMYFLIILLVISFIFD